MSLLHRFIETDFQSYEDFSQNCRLRVPENFNFGFDIVDEYAKTAPDKLALLWVAEDGQERSFTFSEISALSNRAANLFASFGIQKGDMVLCTLKRRWQYWVINVALCKLGAVIIPATHLLTKKDVAYRVNAAEVSAIVSVNESAIAESIDKARIECPTLKTVFGVDGKREGWEDFSALLEQFSPEFPRPTGDKAPKNEDLSVLYFTSGTTGLPKMVVHDFTYPLGFIMGAKFWHGLSEDDLHLTVADTGWAKCSWGKIYGQWICGAAIFVYDMDKFVPEKLAEMVAKYRVTSFCAPPTVYRFMIKADLFQFDLSHLKKASTAGEPLNPEVYKKFYELFGVKIYEAYGQSETAPVFANFQFDEPMPGSLGKPSPMYQIALLDEAGNPCEEGEEGEVCISVKNGTPVGLCKEYYKNPQQNEVTRFNGWYHTGDIAWKDEAGCYWFVGRADDVIKSSGYRIGPFEVESALMTHPAVLECAISGAPDPVRGQVVKATVVLARGYEPSEELKKELQNHVKRVTAPYKYPRIVEFTPELPKTVSGKIKRKQLRLEAEAKAKAFREMMNGYGG
ncbi:MAG: AMP-binding protein [Christensenellales bacterium]|jgi:acetyl-CoA synthetase